MREGGEGRRAARQLKEAASESGVGSGSLCRLERRTLVALALTAAPVHPRRCATDCGCLQNANAVSILEEGAKELSGGEEEEEEPAPTGLAGWFKGWFGGKK